MLMNGKSCLIPLLINYKCDKRGSTLYTVCLKKVKVHSYILDELNFGPIRPWTAELAALERLKKFP